MLTIEQARERMHSTSNAYTYWSERERHARVHARAALTEYQAACRTWLYHEDSDKTISSDQPGKCDAPVCVPSEKGRE